MKKIYFVIFLFTIVYSQDYNWREDKEFRSISIVKELVNDIDGYKKWISVIDSLQRDMMINKKEFTNADWFIYIGHKRDRTSARMKILEIKDKISDLYKEYINEIVRQAAREKSCIVPN